MGAAETGSAPRAGLAAGPPHALWFLALWHLLTAWTWTRGGAGNEAGVEEEEEDDRQAASATVSGAAFGAVIETEAASGAGAEGESGDRLTGKEDGSVSAQDGIAGEA